MLQKPWPVVMVEPKPVNDGGEALYRVMSCKGEKPDDRKIYCTGFSGLWYYANEHFEETRLLGA
ncbi:hypothetical protein NBRC116587_33070 [Pseudoteredinibacter isoporae]